MPFRLNEFRAKIQFITSAEMPALISKAASSTGLPSNTVYIQRALCEALARDLDLPLEDLINALPEPVGWAKHVMEYPDSPLTRLGTVNIGQR